MASVNKAILIGNLGKDPEIRYMPNGDQVAKISIATTEKWKDKNGEKQEKTEWISCVAYRKLAQVMADYCVKGMQIYVSGKMETRKYTDKSGIEKYTTQIVVEEMKILGSKPSGETRDKSEPVRRQESGGFDDDDSLIPF